MGGGDEDFFQTATRLNDAGKILCIWGTGLLSSGRQTTDHDNYLL